MMTEGTIERAGVGKKQERYDTLLSVHEINERYIITEHSDSGCRLTYVESRSGDILKEEAILWRK